MIIRFFKRGAEDTPEFIKEIEVKGKCDDKGFMQLIDVNVQETASEILGKHIVRTGFRTVRSCGDFWSSFMAREGVAKDMRNLSGWCESQITATPDDIAGDLSVEWLGDMVATEDGETDLQIGVTVFDTGYIINSSKKATNILGGKEPVFFEKITSKNFKHSSRKNAKLFKDEKALLKYLKEKRDIFAYVRESANITFGFEPASSLWEHEAKPDVEKEILSLFDEINACEADDIAPDFKFGGNKHDEAYIRMQEMGLWKPVQRDFIRSDKLYMSEFGGAVYDLNEDAKEAVRRTSEYGLPYHVILTHSEIGDMYSVLFVSNSKEDWGMERYDKKTGFIYANVYNTSLGIDEMGTIGVEPANGGLVRTA